MVCNDYEGAIRCSEGLLKHPDRQFRVIKFLIKVEVVVHALRGASMLHNYTDK